MWVYLDSWMVQDGEIPELCVGDTLRGVALRAACLRLHEAVADAREGVAERPEPDPSSGRISYHVTGTVESSPDFVVPPVGARATAVCTWEVLAEHETGSQELRADWHVLGLGIERRDTTPVELRKARILRVDTVDRLHRWADERDGERITYLLDLREVNPGSR